MAYYLKPTPGAANDAEEYGPICDEVMFSVERGFYDALIELVGGEPVVKGDTDSPRRKYTVLGKEKLDDETWQENLPGAQFFKVKVGLQ